MSDLSPAAIDAVDTAGMIADVLAQPHQLADARWRVESAGVVSRRRAGGLVVCGMGGSAIGGELAIAALGQRATRPITVVRGYELPPWASDDALVLCSSYSGETAETLSCYAAAGAAGIERVVLTTGGELAARARSDAVEVVGVPAGMQPRAAVVYMTVGALELAALAGAAPSLGDEVDAAAALLTRLSREWGPDTPSGSPAKRLAHRLRGTVPVVFGAGPTAAAAIRWKTQLNENAEWPAFAAVLPEADHNAICGFGRAVAPLTAVMLDDPRLDPPLRRRIEVTAAELARRGASVERVEAVGETPLERVLSLVLLGDLVSVYLAVLEGTDPTPVEAIEELKAALGTAAKP